MASTTTVRRKTLRTVLLALVAFLLLFSVGSMIFVKNVYDEHFPRVDQPKVSGYLRYADVQGYPRSVVQFESGKNTLTGYLYGQGNKKGLVVISAGAGYGAEDYLPEALYFVGKGWTVFCFDNTGTYASEGKSTVGASQSLLDLDAALTYVESSDALNDLPVMLYGHSWGAYAVTAILKYGHHDHITAVASLSGFNSPLELVGEELRRVVGPLAYALYPAGWAYQSLLFGSTTGITAVSAINSTDTPVMIIHGDHDESVSYSGASIMAHRGQVTNPNVIYKTCSAPDHNGHNNLFESDATAEYKKTVNAEYQVVFDRYNGKVPDDVKAEFYRGVDKSRTSELDAAFMDEINRLFESHVR